MATTALVTTDADAKAAEVEAQVAAAKAQAEAINVTDQASADNAGELLREIARRRKAAEAERKALKEPVLEAGRRIDTLFKNAMAPFDAADSVVRGKLGTWTAEQERIRREEEARLEAERQEREQKAREAREAQEAEERRKREQAEADRREAEQLAREARDDEERAQAEALAEEARVAAEEAAVAEQAIASLPEVSLPKAVVESASKPAGISTRKRWVVKSIVLGALPDEYKIANEKAINAAMRDGLRDNGAPPEIPGVCFEQVDEMAVRG